MVGNGPTEEQKPHTEGVAAESFSAAIPNRLYRDSSKYVEKGGFLPGGPDTGDRFTGKVTVHALRKQ